MQASIITGSIMPISGGKSFQTTTLLSDPMMKVAAIADLLHERERRQRDDSGRDGDDEDEAPGLADYPRFDCKTGESSFLVFRPTLWSD